jgi:hypothetical protein
MRMGSLAVLSALLAVGCATAPPPPTVTPAPSRVRVGMMPVESDAFPRLAEDLNRLLPKMRVRGADETFVSRVTLEVVQISIECVDPTPDCYAAVGKSLAAERLLMSQIVGGQRRRDRSVKVVVSYFDVERGAPIHSIERLFRNQDEARRGISELLDAAVDPRAGVAATASLVGGRR